MRIILLALFTLSFSAMANAEDDNSYADEIRKWQATREEKLRADNGWLTFVGRYPLREGTNSIGTGKHNDVLFPESLEETGPEKLGAVHVNLKAMKVTLQL